MEILLIAEIIWTAAGLLVFTEAFLFLPILARGYRRHWWTELQIRMDAEVALRRRYRL